MQCTGRRVPCTHEQRCLLPSVRCAAVSKPSCRRNTHYLHRSTSFSVKAQSGESQDNNDDGDLLIEKQLKGRSRKPMKSQTKVADLAPPGQQPAPSAQSGNQTESSAVLVLVALFTAIIGQGLFLAVSGFLPESLDDFAQNVVFKTFSPTVGLFLACSAAYGLWKSKQGGK